MRGSSRLLCLVLLFTGLVCGVEAVLNYARVRVIETAGPQKLDYLQAWSLTQAGEVDLKALELKLKATWGEEVPGTGDPGEFSAWMMRHTRALSLVGLRQSMWVHGLTGGVLFTGSFVLWRGSKSSVGRAAVKAC